MTVSGILIDFGGSIEVETSLKFFGTRDPGSLRRCQKQSQISAIMVPRSQTGLNF